MRIFGHKKDINIELTKSRRKKLKDIKIAVILDEFSYNSFKYEFNAITFEPSNWFEIFEKEKPDLFLCESAWHGVDSEKKPWMNKINHHVNSKIENRGVLFEVINYCNKNGITTIFWNKEDPTNFHQFFDTALKFDHIFTTAEECIQRYKDRGHESVHCLMFAAQPKLFNPIEKQERSDEIIFAGSWYSHFSQRCDEMREIFNNILESGFKLKIYDRAYHTLKDNPNRLFPYEYGEFINPPVHHDQLEKVYKESKYSLNINTVTKSKTMFARRIFELMLCNTLVLSNYSGGVDNLFGTDVVFVDKDKFDLSGSEEKRINSLYNVLKNHTYSNRFKQILNTINYEYLPDDDDTVTIYYRVNDQSEIEDVLEHYRSITYHSKKLVLLLSSQIPGRVIKDIHRRYSNDEITVHSINHILKKPWPITNYFHKLSHPWKIQNPDRKFFNPTTYFIFADLQLENDFIEKAISHYSYTETKFGIAVGDKFIFKKMKDMTNVIFHNQNFMKVFNTIFKGNNRELPVYNIQIKPKIKKVNTVSHPKSKPKMSKTKKDKKIFDLDIHGSCVSRDIFNFDDDHDVVLGKYFARNSFISAVSEPFPEDFHLNISSAWQKKVVETDLRKDLFEKLSTNKADYLLIDFIDERLPLMKYKDSIFTVSMELQNSDFLDNFKSDPVDRISLDKFIWKKAMDDYLDKLLSLYDEDKIIIHETYFAYSFKSDNGEIKPFSTEQIEYYKNFNKILKEYYDYVKRKLPHAKVINTIESYNTASENHRWGLAAVHYQDIYYKSALQKIKDIIFVR